MSSTLNDAPWNNTTVINGHVAAEVAKLKEEPGSEIIVAGSAQLFRTPLDHGLVDELRLMIFPVVLGAGKRLIKEAAAMNTFNLAEARQVGPDGVIILIYQPAGVSPRGLILGTLIGASRSSCRLGSDWRCGAADGMSARTLRFVSVGTNPLEKVGGLLIPECSSSAASTIRAATSGHPAPALKLTSATRYCGLAFQQRTGSFSGYVLSVVGPASVAGCQIGATQGSSLRVKNSLTRGKRTVNAP